MPKHKLDNAFVLGASCPDDRKRVDYWDTIITGFVLEARSTGGKTYYLRYQDQHDRQRQHKIGAVGDITFDRAKKEAQRLRSEVVLGGDPAVTKAHIKAIPTYADVAVDHLRDAKTHQKSYATTEMYMRRHILPRWGKLRMSEIHQADVAIWLAAKSAEGLAPATVEKIRVILGRSFELASRWGVAGVKGNPTRGIKRPPINNARSRYLNPAEAQRLQRAVASSRNKQLRYVVGLLLLTGARVSEVLSAEWNNIDLERRNWLIPISKTGKARHVPLSQAAVDLLGQIERKTGARYVFRSRTDPKGHLTSIKHSWQTARDEAVLPDLRIHDLRHSAASFMINSGIDLFAVGRVLGHADHKSTMRYSHLANDTLLAAVEAGANKLNIDWTNDV